MNAFDIDFIASGLVDDGDEYVLTRVVSDLMPPEVQAEAGVWTFRLRIEVDEYMTVADCEDPEVFGRYEVCEYGRGRRDRPAGFTGAAVKIQDDANQGYFYWYEPPKDFRKFKGSGFSTIEEWEKAKELNLRYVRNLLSWGYIVITVDVTHKRSDGYKRSWFESIGGVESGTGLWGEPLKQHNDYVAEIVKEQLNEVIYQIQKESEPCSQPS